MKHTTRIAQAGRVSALAIVVAIAAVAVLVFWFAATHGFEGSLREPVAAAATSPAPVAQASPEAARTNVPPSPAGAQVAGASQASFQPPGEDKIPDDEYGKMIRLGEQVFTDTGRYAAKWVGNDLSCANCHLDAGRKPGSAPMWAAFIHYPAFRRKTGQVDTLASRLQGCFMFSAAGGRQGDDRAADLCLLPREGRAGGHAGGGHRLPEAEEAAASA